MDQLTNYKHKIDFLLISNDTSLGQQTQTTANPKPKRKKYEKCNECNKRRKTLDESHQICHVCYKMKKIFKPSGNKVIDDFIRYTPTNLTKEKGKMEFVPYEQFKNVEFIAEGGFSKIYKATWIDGPITDWNDDEQKFNCKGEMTVALKELNNSENINSKELNEVQYS